MSLKIKLKILAAVSAAAIMTVVLYLLNDTGNVTLSADFFRGLVVGITAAAAAVCLVSIIVTLYRRKKTDEQQKIEAYNRQLIIGAGWLCLLTGIFLTRMESAGEIVYIISSVFFIVSIVLMTSYLSKMKKRRSEDAAV
jgi:hypothetical protein